jgi:hypothetical protein
LLAFCSIFYYTWSWGHAWSCPLLQSTIIDVGGIYAQCLHCFWLHMFGCDENEYIVILFPHFNLWCSFWWSPSGGFVLIPVIPLVCFLLHPNWTHANMGNWLMCVDYQQPKSTSFQSFTTCKQNAVPEWCFMKPPCTSREWEIALWRSPNWGIKCGVDDELILFKQFKMYKMKLTWIEKLFGKAKHDLNRWSSMNNMDSEQWMWHYETNFHQQNIIWRSMDEVDCSQWNDWWT